MLGGKRKLAYATEVSPSLVTRWCKKGWIDPTYNPRVKSAIANHAASLKGHEAEEFARAALACLESEDVCRCCGQPWPKGRVL